jgi:DUF177 domain-containing protein
MAEPRIPLEGAQEKPLVFRDEVSVSVEALGGEPLLSVSPLALEGEITFADGEYFLDAVLSFSGSVECSRCLEPFAFEQQGPVRLRLHPRPAPRAAAEFSPAAGKGKRPGKAPEPEDLELEEADLDVFFYDEPVLPFAEIAREQAIISLPMKPLCREECLGLCPECGKDLNAGDCACDKKRGDPRLEILKDMR